MAARSKPIQTDADAAELITLSRAVGSDADLVQGGGGNTSVKSSDGLTMYVKASGTALGKMAPGKGYRRVRLAGVLDMLTDPRLGRVDARQREREALERLVAVTADDLDGRPSVETSLHACLGRAVAHTHPAIGNAICCARDGKRLAEEWFAEVTGPPLFMPYVDPGLPLARSTFRAVKRYARDHGKPPALILLKNHGVFVSAATGRVALRITRRVDAIIRARWKERRTKERGEHAIPARGAPQAKRRKVASAMQRVWSAELGLRNLTVRYSAAPGVAAALAHPEVERLVRVPPLTPDHVVYAHGQPVWLATADGADVRSLMASALDRAKARLPKTPVTMLVSGVGLFTVAPDRSSADAALAITSASLLTLLAAEAFGGCLGLTRRAIDYLEEWEVESFRRKVAKAGAG